MSAAKPSTSSGSEWFINFLMGGVAASISKTVAAPIERVKLLVQIRPNEYRGIVSTFGKVYVRDRSWWARR
ncbi:hypothetical protein IAR55_002000 [Kwoniella newhampshirensis]|uniref:ADP,ATP carrier protein n=1 Tax=Kwoniella newhampshirensis TaxID=1651941 RepID=A0AAW0Z3L4_9TREE